MTNSSDSTRAIEDSFYCARYVPASKIDQGEVTGSAFMLRMDGDGTLEEYLSVSCPNLTDQESFEKQLAELSRIYIEEKDFTPGKTSAFALFQVGQTTSYVKATVDASLRFQHIPEDDDKTHTGVFGIEYDNDLISELIADCVGFTFPVYTKGS